MKKRLLCLLLSVLLIGAIPVSAATAFPVVMILSVQVSEEGVTLTYWLQDGTPSQELACLVADQEGTILQILQTDEVQNGIHTLTLPVKGLPDEVTVSLGGTSVGTYRTVTFTNTYVADCLFISSGQTTASLKANLNGMENVTVTSGEEPLSDDAVISSGCELQGDWNGQTVTLSLVLPGDATLDGKVNAADALQILRYIVGKISLDDAAFNAADFRQNGQVGATSALMVLQYTVGKINTL